MLLKPRTEPELLTLLRLLENRIKFTEDEMVQYTNLSKGYEGELMFDQLTARLDCEMFIINDLFLEHNHSKFQIDSLLIKNKTIIPCEVKNYYSNYFFEDGEFRHCITKKEITNPLHQMKRSEILLRQFLQKLGFHFQIDSYLTFINPEFFLYQAPQNQSIIFPPQLGSFMTKLNSKGPKLDEVHRKLADKLVGSHTFESPYPKLPPYDYHSIRKGMQCGTCHSFEVIVGEKKLICYDCGTEEDSQSAIVRHVEEFKLLFPGQKVTTNLIFDWCTVVESRKKIRKVLTNNYKVMGTRQWTYYE
ncbi:nuclease-related domain-containing protein [Neobacillus niacini]|uniref:nuclease-related domain-containing protein n=1 Tax=Neobacillus niacini TaxID=86668 RepID=UPI002FFEFBF2